MERKQGQPLSPEDLQSLMDEVGFPKRDQVAWKDVKEFYEKGVR